MTIEGELVQLDFRNPHSFVHVDVKQKDGTTVRYASNGAVSVSLASRASHARHSRSAITSSSAARPAAMRRTTACAWSH